MDHFPQITPWTPGRFQRTLYLARKLQMGTRNRSGFSKWSTCLEDGPKYDRMAPQPNAKVGSKDLSGEIKKVWQSVYTWSVQVKRGQVLVVFLLQHLRRFKTFSI